MECIFVMACPEKFTIYDFFLKKVLKVLKVLKCVTWWCGMSIHVILPWDLIISMSIFLNYKLPSATCHYPKQLKNISLNMS